MAGPMTTIRSNLIATGKITTLPKGQMNARTLSLSLATTADGPLTFSGPITSLELGSRLYDLAYRNFATPDLGKKSGTAVTEFVPVDVREQLAVIHDFDNIARAVETRIADEAIVGDGEAAALRLAATQGTAISPETSEALLQSMVLLRSGIMARFPDHKVLQNEIAGGLFASWRTGALDGTPATEEEIFDMITTAADPHVHTALATHMRDHLLGHPSLQHLSDENRQFLAANAKKNYTFPSFLTAENKADVDAHVESYVAALTTDTPLAERTRLVREIIRDRTRSFLDAHEAADKAQHVIWIVSEELRGQKITPMEADRRVAEVNESLFVLPFGSEADVAPSQAYWSAFGALIDGELELPKALSADAKDLLTKELANQLMASNWSAEEPTLAATKAHMTALRKTLSAQSDLIALKDAIFQEVMSIREQLSEAHAQHRDALTVDERSEVEFEVSRLDAIIASLNLLPVSQLGDELEIAARRLNLVVNGTDGTEAHLIFDEQRARDTIAEARQFYALTVRMAHRRLSSAHGQPAPVLDIPQGGTEKDGGQRGGNSGKGDGEDTQGE